MNAQPILIETAHSPEEVLSKISKATLADDLQAHKSANTSYYGKVAHRDFEIKDVKYSPHSAAPSLKGEVQQHNHHSRIKLDINIKNHYRIIRDMYYTTMFPIGIIIMALSVYVLKGSDFLIHGIAFSSVFIVLPIVVTAITKSTLIKTKKKEIENFLRLVNGKIISA